MKWSLVGELDSTEAARRSVDMGTVLRDRGYPTPATVAHGRVDTDTYAWIQQRLPGTAREDLGDELLSQLLDAIELQRGVHRRHRLSGGAWPAVAARVHQDHLGDLWQAARFEGGEIAALARRLRLWARECPAVLGIEDYVHLDLNCFNILSEDGQTLRGIVDLDSVSVGNRGSDLAYLAMHYASRAQVHGSETLPDAYFRLREAARRISGEAGWRQGMAYGCIGWLAWVNPEGRRVDRTHAVGMVSRILAEETRTSTPDRRWRDDIAA